MPNLVPCRMRQAYANCTLNATYGDEQSAHSGVPVRPTSARVGDDHLVADLALCLASLRGAERHDR